MAIQQTLLGVGNNPKFVGYTMSTSGIAGTLTLDYPDCNDGDLLIAYIVAENLSVPIADGWTSLYSNTTTASNGSGSAPTWQVGVPSGSASNLAGGSAGQLP